MRSWPPDRRRCPPTRPSLCLPSGASSARRWRTPSRSWGSSLSSGAPPGISICGLCVGRDRPPSSGVQGRKYAAGKSGAPAAFLHPTVAAETGSCALAQVPAADIPAGGRSAWSGSRPSAGPLQGHTTYAIGVVCYTAWLARRGSS